MINLAKNLKIETLKYASQGNAILGIRDSGKSYTAMKIAEELLEAKIPIVAFDPVGIWRHLKSGIDGNKGYEVVVAGGNYPDLNLTVESAPNIIRAAMNENIPLIIDLYSVALANKSKWIRIVQESIDILMYENKDLRHIFLEEAAEFIPQRLQPQHSKVYGSIERLARMGRNAKLGYTLINQRAEEVNKAILEIAEFSILHKQVGKNSLMSIKKWLDLRQVNNVDSIIKALPTLTSGEAFCVGLEGEPLRIHVSKKKTYHPNPKKVDDINYQGKTVNISKFVERMKKVLEIKPLEEKFKKEIIKSLDTPLGSKSVSDKQLNEQLLTAKHLLNQQQVIIKQKEEKIKFLEFGNNNNKDKFQKLIDDLRKLVESLYGMPSAKMEKLGLGVPTMTHVERLKSETSGFLDFQRNLLDNAHKQPGVTRSGLLNPHAFKSNENGSLNKCPKAILTFLYLRAGNSFTKPQIGAMTGYSPNSGGFNNALSELRQKDLIQKDNSKYTINPSMPTENIADNIDEKLFSNSKESLEQWLNKLNKCPREIYNILLNHSNQEYTKDELGEITGYSSGSGGFNNALSNLCTLGLAERVNGLIRLNQELLKI
jgi:hypothetical protein